MGIEILATAGFLAATGAASAYTQYEKGKDAAEEQKKANKLSQTQAAVESARNRRRAIAQARVAQARNIASQSTSVSGSSAVSGVNSSLSSQLGANIGAQSQLIGSQRGIATANQRAADDIRQGQSQAGFFNAVGDTAKFAFMNAGGGS